MIGAPGYVDGICAGFNIGISAVKEFANNEIKMKVIEECVSGQKKICLAISDAFAGSDVGGLHCTASKSECGQFY